MIVDASALIALLLREPGWERIAGALAQRQRASIGAPTLVETVIVLHAKGAPSSMLSGLLQRTGMLLVPFTERHASIAVDAYASYVRGRPPASLNFGDCMTYAVARFARAQLLCVGDDFSLTDLEPVPTYVRSSTYAAAARCRPPGTPGGGRACVGT